MVLYCVFERRCSLLAWDRADKSHNPVYKTAMLLLVTIMLMQPWHGGHYFLELIMSPTPLNLNGHH